MHNFHNRDDVNIFYSELLKSDRAGHAFFGRRGGVSSGVYSSLNFHEADASCVEANKSVIATAIGVGANRLKNVHQTHTNTVVVVDDTNVREDLSYIEGDAMVTKIPGVALCVFTADCCPVLMLDPAAGVIAAVHAGWRGAFAGVVGEAVKAMVRQGAAVQNIVAAIGPSIAWESYEVDSAFKEAFVVQREENSGFFKSSARPEHCMFHLKGYVASELMRSGIVHYEDVSLDTYSLEYDFFSCRRAFHKGERGFGNQASLIYLRD